ncbi:S-adenosyl-l-methionine hydroxide adenosyltransferase family protein [Alkalihalobacillus sp. FSL W8-0930]
MNQLLVLQSDFGLSDGAVSAMYGVALSVNPDLTISNLTHDIPPFHIWEASYRLLQTVPYWPKETVFVSVVDPGVGSKRKSIVARLVTGQFVITPDNGTLSHLLKGVRVDEVRELDETKNRLPHSGESYTFHGRDIYAYTGARLASGVISFNEVGGRLNSDQLVRLDINEAKLFTNEAIGQIDILDIRYGNAWTNIPRTLFTQTGATYGDQVKVLLTRARTILYQKTIPFGRSFADVPVGQDLLYVNSLDYLAIGTNQKSFADANAIGTGTGWVVSVQPHH